jgi:hypothetical protein
MKSLDDLFESVKKLEAPDSLQRRVMEAIRADEAAEKYGWLVWPADWLRGLFQNPARAGFALACVSVAVAVMIGVHAPRPDAPAMELTEKSEINEFLRETIGPVYAARWDINSGSIMVSEDVNEFVKTSVESVFWINGDSDNA